MKFPLSFCKLVMAAAVALPTMALATITPVTPQQDTDNCYMIGSAAELYGFAEMVNGTGGGFNGCGKLTADIVVNENLLTESNVGDDGTFIGSNPAHIWFPMGTSEAPFKGSFHGQGHTISGLYFNDPEKEKVGLFGNAGDVEIDGLGLVDSYFDGLGSVGGFVGYAGGTVYIRNSYNSSVVRGLSAVNDWWCGVGGFVGAAEVNKLEIENSYNLGFVTGGPAVGGLVGIIKVNENFSVSNSYNAGDVKGTAEVVGGLVGFVGYLFSDDVDAGIVSSYNTGSVVCGGEEGVGGLVGYLDYGFEIRIVNSYNTGTVDGNYAGGLVGGDGGGWAGYANVYNSYNAGLVNGGDGDALGLYDEVDNFYYLEGSSGGFYTSKSAEEFADGTVAEALHDWCEKDGDVCKEGGLDGSVWGQGFGRDALPTLTGAIGPALTLHVYDGVVIDSAYTQDTDLPKPTREGFAFLGWYADAGFSGSAVTNIPSDATGALEYFAKWEAQGGSGCIEIASAEDLFSFAARVNGGDGEICGKLTDNITVNEGLLDYVDGGTFDLDGYKADHGNVEPKAWTPIGTKGSGMSGKPFKGTFYGNGHTISGLYFNSQEQINSTYKGLFGYVEGEVVIDGVGIVDSYIYGFNYVGGLVGGLGNGAVLTISKSYNAGFVGGNSGIGGLVGGEFTGGTSLKTSAVNINNSYNLGRVKGGNNVGGLVGQVVVGDISNSYNAGLVSSVSNPIVGSCLSMTITNSYYLGAAAQGNYGTNKTASEFANGSVAKALHDWCEKETGSDKCKEGGLDGSVWGQDLRKENSLPEFIERLDCKMGGMTFFELAGKIDSAYVDAASDIAVNFPNDVVVSGPVKFKRSFPTMGVSNGYSTIMLPFTPKFETDADTIEGVNFYAFSNYEKATISVTPVKQMDLEANTPYLVQAADVTELVFGKGGTFNTTTGGVSKNGYKVELSGTGWTIFGTYAYKQWLEGDEGLGKTYGFVGAGDNEASEVGKFKKAGAGAYIYPMRAYLKYEGELPKGAPRIANNISGAIASLPETINVVIDVAGDASDDRTVIGTISTRTGEFKFATDRWFDLNGRYLGSKKPTQKGAYYNNGKKVIVK